MSIHLEAGPGAISSSVIITGDPLRAKYIAESMLESPTCYNQIRGMLGYTGMYKGKRVSVQGTGMGIPSTAIYLHELITEYGVRTIIRVGTCGAIQSNLKIGQLLIAEESYTDSAIEEITSGKFLQKASYKLLEKCKRDASSERIDIKVGSIFSTDSFYSEIPNRWSEWISRGVLAVEMETSILYTLANKHSIDALTILEVSDNIITGEIATSSAREKIGKSSMELALGLL